MQKKIGFSLIELMVVLAIIGILAVMAVPSYQDYTFKARYAEIIAATSPYQTAVSLALQEGITAKVLMTGTNGIPAAPPATKNLGNLKVDQGTIIATATALLKNATFILVPNHAGTAWTVKGTCLDLGLCHSV